MIIKKTSDKIASNGLPPKETKETQSKKSGTPLLDMNEIDKLNAEREKDQKRVSKKRMENHQKPERVVLVQPNRIHLEIQREKSKKRKKEENIHRINC